MGSAHCVGQYVAANCCKINGCLLVGVLPDSGKAPGTPISRAFRKNQRLNRASILCGPYGCRWAFARLFRTFKDGLQYVRAYNGVTFFFVLSGFILTYNYRRLDAFDKIWRFAVGPFARIWPLHVTTFVLAVLLLQDVRLTLFTPTGLGEVALNLTLLQALVPVLGFQFSYNAVSWSISAEWYFYTCFIGLNWLIGRPFSRLLPIVIAGSIVMMSICMALPYYDPDPFALSVHTMIYLHHVADLLDLGIV